jgi:paraquat-inducible protein A
VTSSDVPLALTIAATLTFLIANLVPLMSISAVGRTATTTILGGAIAMWNEGEQLTGALVGFCAVLAPAGHLLFLLVLFLATRRPKVPRFAGEMLRAAEHVQLWSMLEVMMLGILVALIKIAQLATVEPGIGMLAVGATMLLIPAIVVSFDPRDVWERIEWPTP